MKKTAFLSLLAISVHFAKAQTATDAENVMISHAQKEFRFVKGNTEHPVQIKEKSKITYTCTSYRTDVPVAEFYSDMVTIDDVSIQVDGLRKHGVVPRYEYYNDAGIFYSDARICYLELPLPKKGSSSHVSFEKTVLDPHYFTSIYFTSSHPVGEQEIKIIVPDWMQLEIKDFNFKQHNVQKNIAQNGSETIYTYTMKNLPARSNENSAPGPSYFSPHILVLCKSAQPKTEKYVYFNTVKEQYAWYKKLVEQIGNDENIIKEKAEEITKGLASDVEKVKILFQWVQDNIRYIAFENGIAGFKPEKAQEVLRKKYGDCKGMANLLTVMLQSLKLDGRRCWIGTKHIAYDYSTPSLSVDNHMISAWMNKGKPVFLDPTEKYIGFGEVAERIQGRQTLIEDGSNYILGRVPVATHLQNTAVESRKLSIDGNNLKGHVVQTWKGENKEWLLSQLNSIKQDKQENALMQFLSEGKTNFEISNFKVTNIDNYNADLKAEYDVVWKDVLTVFDQDTYLAADNRRSLENFKIDTSKRKLPYWFNFKDNLVFETEILLPAGKTVSTLPEKLSVKQPGYSFVASYNSVGGKVMYKNEIILNHAEINPANFSQWNRDIEQLAGFYNQQVVLTKK